MNPEPVAVQHVCLVCGYVYDESAGDAAAGVAPGTPWQDLPPDWLCPDCGVGHSEFAPVS